MGWTSYHVDGEIDRKAECDAYFEKGLNEGHFKVVKSVLIGSVYYAAVQNLTKAIKIEDKVIYIPTDKKRIFGVVILTRVIRKEYYNFSYKVMDESMGPCYYDCPKYILDCLTETEYEYAINWRNKCREHTKKKNQLNSLKPGSIIKAIPKNGYTEKESILLKKYEHSKGNFWSDGKYRWKSSMLESYEIIKKG